MQKGEIYLVSTGAGGIEQITQNAILALDKAELIVGYTKYIKDIEPLLQNKEVYTTGMTHEVERCKYAIKQALNLKKVALISNGDVNVYGMAGLLLEIVEANNLWSQLEIVIEPGITTLLATAAKTGAPIMSDFAVVSLSNLLNPIELIRKRLINALDADFVLGIYNPLSHSRKEPYQMFLEILPQYRNIHNPVVIAQNIGRDTEKIWIKTVADLLNIRTDKDLINMSTILIIGNTTTKLVNSGKMLITQRGYQTAYDYSLNSSTHSESNDE